MIKFLHTFFVSRHFSARFFFAYARTISELQIAPRFTTFSSISRHPLVSVKIRYIGPEGHGSVIGPRNLFRTTTSPSNIRKTVEQNNIKSKRGDSDRGFCTNFFPSHPLDWAIPQIVFWSLSGRLSFTIRFKSLRAGVVRRRACCCFLFCPQLSSLITFRDATGP